MDVWRITVAALRRWYVLLPLLGVTALMVLATGRGVQPEYDVTGATMLVPGSYVQEIPNPYGGPSDANNAVGIVLNSPETRRQIAEQGLVPTYQVAPQSRSTVMNFEVRGDSPEVAIATGIAVFQMAAKELRDRQAAAGISRDEQYTIDVLQSPSVSAAVTDGKLRNMAVVGVLGGAMSLVIAVFFDDVVGLSRRRRRRGKEAEQDSQAPAQGAAEIHHDVTVDPRPAIDTTAAAAQTRPSASDSADQASRQRKLRKPKRSSPSADAGVRGTYSDASRSTAVSDAT